MAIACQPYQPYGHTVGYKAFFCRAQDAAWTALYEKPTAMIDSVAFHGGKIYCMDTSYYLYVYDVGMAASPSPAPGPVPLQKFNMYSRLSKGARFPALRGAYLVTCNSELLLVVLRMGSGQLAEVYRTEWEADGALLPLRDRVTDLGEHSLFVGRDETFSLSAKEFPSIKGNHLYYCVPHNRNYDGGRKLHHWAFVFDLGSDAVEEIPYPRELRDDGTNWSPRSWFCLRRPFVKQ
jgi:hypothetical protein